jgi:hypothetical protein
VRRYVGFQKSPEIGEAREALTDVVATGHRAGDIITNVRRLFGKDTLEDTPCDVNTLEPISKLRMAVDHL